MGTELKLTQSLISEVLNISQSNSAEYECPFDYLIKNIVVHSDPGADLKIALSLKDKENNTTIEIAKISLLTTENSQSIMGDLAICVKDPYENLCFNMDSNKSLVFSIIGEGSATIYLGGEKYDY